VRIATRSRVFMTVETSDPRVLRTTKIASCVHRERLSSLHDEEIRSLAVRGASSGGARRRERERACPVRVKEPAIVLACETSAVSSGDGRVCACEVGQV